MTPKIKNADESTNASPFEWDSYTEAQAAATKIMSVEVKIKSVILLNDDPKLFGYKLNTLNLNLLLYLRNNQLYNLLIKKHNIFSWKTSHPIKSGKNHLITLKNFCGMKSCCM